MQSTARIDHIVILAPDLASGAAWCETTLGVTPGPGGEHPLMGTHNRLLRIASANHPAAYLEIIAVNPRQPTPHPPRPARWFDIDDADLSAGVRSHGPQLIHFVASVPDVDAAVGALRRLDIDRGEVLQAGRMTPSGLLQWKITVRPDGRRLFDGALPTLIEWGPVHPAAAMPESGLALQSLDATHPQAASLQAAYAAIGLDGVAVKAGAARLSVTLNTPRGLITLNTFAPTSP